MPGEHDGRAHPIVAALYDPVTAPFERRFGPYRAALVEDVAGDVLDVGAGTGATFPHLCARREVADRPVHLHAVEPDPAMRRRAARRATSLECEIDLRGARAEALPFPDGSTDVALLVLTACTIPDVDRALEELHRVLVPGGEVRFIEHVRADGLPGRLQDGLAPVWRRLAAGCHLNRDTVGRFRRHPGFSVETLETIDPGVYPVAPMVRGRLGAVDHEPGPDAAEGALDAERRAERGPDVAEVDPGPDVDPDSKGLNGYRG